MKIIIWIREDKDGKGAKIRTDYKFENNDTPAIQRVGNRILNALEGESS